MWIIPSIGGFLENSKTAWNMWDKMLNHQDLYQCTISSTEWYWYLLSWRYHLPTRVGKLRAGTNFRKRNIFKRQLGKNENDHSYLLTNYYANSVFMRPWKSRQHRVDNKNHTKYYKCLFAWQRCSICFW